MIVDAKEWAIEDAAIPRNLSRRMRREDRARDTEPSCSGFREGTFGRMELENGTGPFGSEFS